MKNMHDHHHDSHEIHHETQEERFARQDRAAAERRMRKFESRPRKRYGKVIAERVIGLARRENKIVEIVDRAQRKRHLRAEMEAY